MNDSAGKSLENVTLAIIAGGQGTRMGRPKAWLEISGTPVLSWILNRLQWPGPTMLVTAPAIKFPSGCQQFSQQVVDPVDGLGPMRGVLTALEKSSTDLVVAIAVDMPLIEQSYLEWLTTELAARPTMLSVMGSIQRESEEEPEPFPRCFPQERAIDVIPQFKKRPAVIENALQ